MTALVKHTASQGARERERHEAPNAKGARE